MVEAAVVLKGLLLGSYKCSFWVDWDFLGFCLVRVWFHLVGCEVHF